MAHSTRRRKRRNQALAFRPEPESEADWKARLARIREGLPERSIVDLILAGDDADELLAEGPWTYLNLPAGELAKGVE